MNGVEAYAEDRASAMRRYTDLEGENARLVEENIALRNAHERLRYMLSRQRLTGSSADGQFCYHTAHVVNNTVSLPRNLFTIDRGRADGIHDGMGVLAYGNVVGIVVAVAPHYSKAISLLNKDLRISARLSRGLGRRELPNGTACRDTQPCRCKGWRYRGGQRLLWHIPARCSHRLRGICAGGRGRLQSGASTACGRFHAARTCNRGGE